jgi:hypothetical protein
MADAVSNLFEIERRSILFKSSTTMPDLSVLGYNGNPNLVISGNSDGQFLLYNCPIGSSYIQDNGTIWDKTVAPNTWVVRGSGSDYTTISEISAISGYLQSQIVNLSGNYATLSYVDDISSNFGDRITLLEARPTQDVTLRSDVETISSNFRSEIDNIYLNYVTDAHVLTISSNLQSEIDNIYLNYSTLAHVNEISSNLQSHIDQITEDYATLSYVNEISSNILTEVTNISSNFDDRITLLEARPIQDVTLRSEVETISSNFRSEIDNIYLNYATLSYVNEISSNIQNQIYQITNDYTTLTEVSSISGYLQDEIELIDSRVAYTESVIDSLNDALTNNLMYIGTEPCEIDKQIYTIDFNNTFIVPPIPVVTLSIPEEHQSISVLGVYDVTTTDFKVYLSQAPSVSGYSINWMVGLNSAVSSVEPISAQLELDASNVTYNSPTYATVEDALNFLLYIPPEITSFSNNAGTFEIGSTANNFSLNWSFNKSQNNFVSSTINGGSLTNFNALGLTSKNLFAQNLKTSTTFTLQITEYNTSNVLVPKQATTSISFNYKRYWGTNSNTVLTDAQIIALSSELTTGKSKSFTQNGNGEYIYYAYPKSFGTASFVVNGLQSTAWTLSEQLFTNASDHEELYYVYHTNTIQNGTGISITVS